MKSLYLRSGLALLCAATLASCGGGNGSMVLGGVIYGLNKPGLILANGSETVAVDAGATTFSFPNLIATDEQFNITIQQPPTGAKCTLTSGTSGKANVYTVQQVRIDCLTNSYPFGGVVNGLDSIGLVLANGPDTISITPPTVAGQPVKFTFPANVYDGGPYGITILSQPQNSKKTCSVINGVGYMGTQALTADSSPASPLVINCI